MPDRSDVLWFKQQFQARVEPLLASTPLSVDMIAAIACQETGHIWSVLRRKNLPVERVLALCVGDTLDANRGRRAFPRDKADLLSKPHGAEMFDIAHQALVSMAVHVTGYADAAANPSKFCHGFGMFQRDLQFFLSDPDYFLQRKYELFEETAGECIAQLRHALAKLGLTHRASLSDVEFASVGIAYNTGGFSASKGLKQGYFDGVRFYGEQIFEFIRLAHTVPLPLSTVSMAAQSG